MPPKKKMPDVPFQKPVAGQNPIFIDTPLYAHRKTDSASFTAGTPKNDIHASYRRDLKKKMSAEKRERYPTHPQNIPIPLPPDGLHTEKRSLHSRLLDPHTPPRYKILP